MSPIDDSVRQALQRAAAQAPDAPHLDGASVERRANRLRTKRASLAVAVSVVLVAGVAVGASTLRTNHSTTLKPAPPAATTGVAGWGFRGDKAIWTKDATFAEVTYNKYLYCCGGNAAVAISYTPLYAGKVLGSPGDVVTFLASAKDLPTYALTAVGSGTSFRLVADQPVNFATQLIDARLTEDIYPPSGPGNGYLGLTAPGNASIALISGTSTIAKPTSNGVAQFSINDGVSALNRVAIQDRTTVVYERVAGLFGVDGSQPGRLSLAESASSWVYEEWLAGQYEGAVDHIEPAAAKVLFAQKPPTPPTGVYPAGEPDQCTRTSPIGSNVIEDCRFISSTYDNLVFTAGGGPSLGFTVTATSRLNPAQKAAAGARTCKISDLALDYRGGGLATQSDFGGLIVRNTSATACKVSGPFVATPLDKQGNPTTPHRPLVWQVPATLLTPHATLWPRGDEEPASEKALILLLSGWETDQATGGNGPCNAVTPAVWSLSPGNEGALTVANFDPEDHDNSPGLPPSLYGCEGMFGAA